jgi:phospholipid/cholesterol/gamma-HCH transport system permease protein
MDRLIDTLTRRGAATLAWLRGWHRLGRFAAAAVAEALTPATYNSATRSVVRKQIYFTAWQILPGFTLFAAVLSYVLIQIVVDAARNYGFAQHALEASVRILVLEILPLLTALFVGLRSGAAINTEVALMIVHNEMHALEETGVDPMRFEFIPRVIGGVISVLALTAVASALALLLAYLAVYGLQYWSLPEFNRVMGNVFDPLAIMLLWGKVLAFGLAVTVIPISEGLAAPPAMLFFVPISVLRGMVRLFFVLMLVEVISLALKYI